MQSSTFEIGILQVRAHRILQDYVRDLLAPFKLLPTQWFILGLLQQNADGMRVTDIAGALGVEPPLITMLSKPLIKQDLVRKQRSSQDQRARVLTLSGNGLRLVPLIEDRLQRQLRALFPGTTAAELEAYLSMLQSIVEHGAILPSTPPDPATDTDGECL